MRKRDIRKELRTEKEDSKKYIEMTFQDIKDSVKYTGKVKISDMENEDYVITLYKKGLIYKKLRRLGVVENSEDRVIKYRQIPN